jgi:MFS family permease
MDPSTAATSARPRRNPLINRNYARLWGGQLVSNLGDFVFDTTLIVWIAAQLAKGQPWAPLAVSGVFVAATAPILLVGSFAGVFVDRWDKRRTMLTMDAARAALILLLLVLAGGVVPLPFVPGGVLPLQARLAAIYAVVFLAATCAQFFNPSRQALIASVVDEAQQPQASSLGQVSYALATIIGPPLAAPLLFAFGVQWALLINAASFVVSFLALASIRVSREATHPAAHERSGLLREYGTGLRFFFTNRILVTILIALVITGLGAGAINALNVFFFTHNLHTPAQYYGFGDAAYAAGALIGAVLGGLFARRLGLTRLVWLSLLALGLSIGVFSRMTSLGPALPILCVMGFPQATLNIAVGPLFMRVTPRHLLGRVVAILNPIFTIATLLSTALAGYLASVLLRGFSQTIAGVTFGPLDTLFGAAALLLILGGLYALLNLRGVTLPSANIHSAAKVSVAESVPTAG